MYEFKGPYLVPPHPQLGIPEPGLMDRYYQLWKALYDNPEGVYRELLKMQEEPIHETHLDALWRDGEE